VFIVMLGTAASLGITAWAGLDFTLLTTQVCIYVHIRVCYAVQC